MKYLCTLALEKIGLFKIMNIKPNFSKLEKETGINRHTLSDMYYERREIKARIRRSQLVKYKDEIRELLKDATVSITAAYFYFTDEERGVNKINCTFSNFIKYVEKHHLNEKELAEVIWHITMFFLFFFLIINSCSLKKIVKCYRNV